MTDSPAPREPGWYNVWKGDAWFPAEWTGNGWCANGYWYRWPDSPEPQKWRIGNRILSPSEPDEAAVRSICSTLVQCAYPRCKGFPKGCATATAIITALATMPAPQPDRGAVIEEQLEVAVAALERIANRGAGPIAHRLECKFALDAIRALKSAPAKEK